MITDLCTKSKKSSGKFDANEDILRSKSLEGRDRSNRGEDSGVVEKALGVCVFTERVVCLSRSAKGAL